MVEQIGFSAIAKGIEPSQLKRNKLTMPFRQEWQSKYLPVMARHTKPYSG